MPDLPLPPNGPPRSRTKKQLTQTVPAFSRAEMRAIVGGAAIDVGEGRRASLPMRVSIAFYLISRWLGSSPPTGS